VEPVTVEEIRARWHSRTDKIRSAKIMAQVSITSRAFMRLNPDDLNSRPVRAVADGKPVYNSKTLEVQVLFDGNRLRVKNRALPKGTASYEQIVRSRKATEITFVHEAPDARPTNTAADPRHSAESLFSEVGNWPILIHFFPFYGDRDLFKNVTVLDSIEALEPSQLQLQQAPGKFEREPGIRFTLDEKLDYALVRQDLDRKGKPVVQSEVKHVLDPHIGPVPISWRYLWLDPDGTPFVTMEGATISTAFTLATSKRN
jgi:hypothetical protein